MATRSMSRCVAPTSLKSRSSTTDRIRSRQSSPSRSLPPRVSIYRRQSNWQRLREIADQYDVVLIADEVITGFGRTGEYFAPMNWDVEPDITTVAKSLTSGYAPLGAAIATRKISDAFIGGPDETFRHLVTFGGHPVSSAAALANLDIFENEDLPGNSKRMGEYLYDELQRLRDHEIVGDVRGGLGLLAAVELVQDRENKTSFPPSAGLANRLPPLLFENGIVSFRARRRDRDLSAACRGRGRS